MTAFWISYAIGSLVAAYYLGKFLKVSTKE